MRRYRPRGRAQQTFVSGAGLPHLPSATRDHGTARGNPDCACHWAEANKLSSVAGMGLPMSQASAASYEPPRTNRSSTGVLIELTGDSALNDVVYWTGIRCVSISGIPLTIWVDVANTWGTPARPYQRPFTTHSGDFYRPPGGVPRRRSERRQGDNLEILGLACLGDVVVRGLLFSEP